MEKILADLHQTLYDWQKNLYEAAEISEFIIASYSILSNPILI